MKSMLPHSQKNRADVCPLCGSNRLLRLPYSYQYDKGETHVIRCPNCMLGFLRPMPAAEDIRAFYSAEYFEQDYHCATSEGSYAEEADHMRAAMRPKLEVIGRFKKGGNYLEIGCAGGAALAEAQAFGFDTTGVELSPEMSEWGRAHFGLDIRCGTLDAQRFTDGTFDVVFMGDVIEHLPEPAKDLREIHRIIRPGGILVLEYPMELNHIVPRVRAALQLHKTMMQNPYHLFFYTPPPLNLLLSSCSFHTVLNRTGKMVRRHPLSVFLLDSMNAMFTSMTGKWGDRGFTIAIRN